MAKIAIDAGHGLYTSGKRCMKKLDSKETREWTLNSRIATKVVSILTQAGHNVMRLDDVTGQTDVPLVTRTNKANTWKADYLISIHHNAGVNGAAAGGAIVIRQTGVAGTSQKLQDAVYAAVIAQTGLKGNRSIPKPSQNLHMTRESKMPAVLVECGFMDSCTDVPIILTENFATKCAKGIAEGIMAIAGGKIGGIEKDMTEAELKAYVDARIKDVLAGTDTTVSDSLAAEFEAAKKAGITDGTRPRGYVTREQSAVMALRATKK